MSDFVTERAAPPDRDAALLRRRRGNEDRARLAVLRGSLGALITLRCSFLAGRATTTLRVRELGSATRPAIVGSFDDGASLMSYVGHGGTAVWSSSNVLNSWDMPSLLAQSRQPFLLTLNCLNGSFVAPNFCWPSVRCWATLG